MKKPAIPIILNDFEKQEKEVSFNLGMPGLRIQYFRGPVWGKTNEQLRKQIVEGNNPVNGKPVMKEMVELLTKPLTADEQKTGAVKQDLGPATYTGTPDELQRLFRDKRYTDFLPIILPTEEKVAAMLAQTSHDPDEVLGRMNPGSEAGEAWTYTVKTAAINAVMAGAEPEYFPVILALGSTGMTSVNVSDNGFMAGAVINGRIRDEIGLNYEEGAVGPYALANTAIGRAWSLLSINGGNCGKVGTTYMGTIGNPMNLINIIIAENEEKSPFKPLAVRRGFKPGENVVTLFMGWGVLSAKNWAATVWGPNMDYPGIIKEIYNTQDAHLFGTCAILSPPIANYVRDAGYDTVDKFTEWVTGLKPGAKPPAGGPADINMGVRKAGGTFSVIVTGGSNNNYFNMGGMVPAQSVQIDKWR